MEYLSSHAVDTLTNYFRHVETVSGEEVDLGNQEKQPLVEVSDPPAFPRLIVVFQGVQQIGTFCFGISTGLMMSNYSPAAYCNVTFPENQSCTNYNCTITQQEGSLKGSFSLAGLILGIVCCAGGAVGAYWVTKNFLNTVKLKDD